MAEAVSSAAALLRRQHEDDGRHDHHDEDARQDRRRLAAGCGDHALDVDVEDGVGLGRGADLGGQLGRHPRGSADRAFPGAVGAAREVDDAAREPLERFASRNGRSVGTVDAVPAGQQIDVIAAVAQRAVDGAHRLGGDRLPDRRRLHRIVVADLIEHDEHVRRQHGDASRRVGARGVPRIDQRPRPGRATGRPTEHGEQERGRRTGPHAANASTPGQTSRGRRQQSDAAARPGSAVSDAQSGSMPP